MAEFSKNRTFASSVNVSEPYYSTMIDGATYKGKIDSPSDPKDNILGQIKIARFGNTFMLSNAVDPYNPGIFLNREMITDIKLTFSALEELVRIALRLPKDTYLTRLVDCMWYMLGFGGVTSRTSYIDRSFASNMELMQ